MRSMLAALPLVWVFSCQCGPAGPGGGTGGGSGAAGAGGGAAAGTGGAGPIGVCPTPCSAGQFCSATNTCLSIGTCGANADCTTEGNVCEPDGGTCIPGSMCGSMAVGGALVSPSMIITLDRSCSMTERVGGAGTPMKWTVAVAALNRLTTTFRDRAYFGLTMFPDRAMPSCTQAAAIPIPIGPMKEPQIQAMLNDALDAGDPNWPDGPCVTNIDTGVQQAAADPGLRDPSRRGFVLLISDGAQYGCSAGGGDNGTANTISSLRDAGIDTFVVGFGGGVDTAQLNIFADRGGQPSGDPMTRFFKAEDQASLEAALNAIGSRTLGCTYTLSMTPPDPAKLFVFFDKTRQVLRDTSHSAGWDYDAATNRVTFYGADCDALKNNQVMKLDIVYGCPTPGIN